MNSKYKSNNNLHSYKETYKLPKIYKFGYQNNNSGKNIAKNKLKTIKTQNYSSLQKDDENIDNNNSADL